MSGENRDPLRDNYEFDAEFERSRAEGVLANTDLWVRQQDATAMLAALDALRYLEEQLETTQRILVEERRWREEIQAALDAIVNAKSFVGAGGYAFTGDEAQELAIKRAADLVSSPASEPDCHKPTGSGLI
jgi:hypothetical protein